MRNFKYVTEAELSPLCAECTSLPSWGWAGPIPVPSDLMLRIIRELYRKDVYGQEEFMGMLMECLNSVNPAPIFCPICQRSFFTEMHVCATRKA